MAGPLPPVPNGLNLRILGTTPGEVWENTLNFTWTGASPNSGTLANIASQAQAAWNAHIASLCPNRIINTSCLVTDISSNTGAQGSSVFAQNGTRGDDLIPANAAFLISYPSSLRYRGGHFRTYLLCGGNADNQDGMSWHSAFVTEAIQKWQLFLNGLVGFSTGGLTVNQLVGLKRHGKYAPNSGPPHYVLTTPIVVPLIVGNSIGHAQMASQKGRIGRRGK